MPQKCNPFLIALKWLFYQRRVNKNSFKNQPTSLEAKHLQYEFGCVVLFAIEMCVGDF